MKAEEITIDVNAKLNVDRRTAEGCLKLVEIYLNQNCVLITCKTEEDGSISLAFDEVKK